MSLNDVIRAAASGPGATRMSAETASEDPPAAAAEDEDLVETASEDTETDSEEEDDEGSPETDETAVRSAERERIRAIFQAPEAAAQPGLAAHLALETDTEPKAARRIMASAGPAKVRSTALADRMATQQNLVLGTGAQGTGADSESDKLVQLASRIGGKRKRRA